MIYDYKCEPCDETREVVKPVVEYNRSEQCPSCLSIMIKVFSSFQHYGAKNEDAEYNPAFGQVVNSKNHRKELAKERGWIEIGNENPKNIHGYAEKVREEKRVKSWEDVEI